MRRDSHEQNRRSWNAATAAHNRHKGDQAAHLKAGESTLFPDERELLGDVRGRSLVHLQCNSGQDSLSLAALGARVIGIDISDEAIGFAQRLSADSGLAARFVRADVLDWLAATDERFDLAFASYGVVGWLSELTAWARGIHRVLVPGGRFVYVDFHPAAMMFDEHWVPRFPYSSSGQPSEGAAGVGDYVSRSGKALAPWGPGDVTEEFVNPHPCHEFGWGLGDIVGALLEAGLTLERLREYPYANGARLFDDMRELPDRRFAVPERGPQVPLMFGLSLRK